MNGPLPQHFFVREIENYCKQNLFNMSFGTKKTGTYQISKLKPVRMEPVYKSILSFQIHCGICCMSL